jgi:HD domain
MAIDSYNTSSAEQLLRLGRARHSDQDRRRRLLMTEAVAAVGFIAAAGLLATLGASSRPLSLSALLFTVAAYVVAQRVRYGVGSAWTAPTQLVFVPMLFVLPVPLVPLIVAACSLSDQLPHVLHRQLAPTRVLARVADASYALGPALVFTVFHVTAFSWGRWPVFMLAFLAQLGADSSAGLTRTWLAERIPPARQVPMLWLYATDACLSCVGLLAAASAADKPGLVLLTLPLVAFVWLLARERGKRLDYGLALSTAYRGIAELLGYVAEAKGEGGSGGHDVVDLSRDAGATLGLTSHQRRVLEFVAMLHDVGKISVPSDILNKDGELDEHEREIVRRHTIEGEQILKRLGGAFASVAPYVRACHERYDGRGYPDGLAGDAIPIQARIVFACEALRAMTTDRPQRPAMPMRAALAELRRCAGTQFDPDVVHALERVVAPGGR